MRCLPVAVLLLGLSGQAGFAGQAAAQTAPTGQDSGATPSVVITAKPEDAQARPSAWKRAETDHLIVYSDGDQAQLVRITQNLERLHAVLERLYKARTHASEPPQLKVVLFGAPAALRNAGLRDIDADEGPFAKPFVGQRYYAIRPGGSLIVLARTDQVVDLDTDKAHDADCDDLVASESGAESGGSCVGTKSYHLPTTRSWEAVLYGAYAQHMLLHYAPAPYPRWYFDGIGAVFSTTQFKRDGSVEYGRPPDDYRLVLRAYGRLDTPAVLTGQYLHTPSTRMDWTPYHAWLLTHFFVMSNLKGEERAQFVGYMGALAKGKTMAEAAQAFGTMRQLRNDLRDYVNRGHDYAKTVKSAERAAPTVTSLSPAAADAMIASLAGRS